MPAEPLGRSTIARIITYGGQQYGLLLAQPNWDTAVTVGMELPTDVEKQPITFNESRRNFARSCRYTMGWRSYLPNALEATELRIFLTRVRGEGVLVPLWPDVCEIATAVTAGATSVTLVDLPARFGSTWIIAKADFSVWELVTVSTLNQSTKVATLAAGTAHAWDAGDQMYPMMLGRLDERPKPEAITDETLEVDFKIRENSQFAWRLTPPGTSVRLVGDHVSGFSSTPLWDIPPNFARPLDWTEMPDVVYQHVGFLREDQQRVYDHRNARGLELEFYQNTRSATAKVEYFWRSMRATTLRFMVPTFRGDLRMLEDTPDATDPTLVNCEFSEFGDAAREAQPGDPFIAFIDADNSVDPYRLSEAANVSGDSPFTQLTSTVNVGAHTATTTILSHLLLARFVDATMEWSYTTPYLATTRIKFQELPHEYDETPAALPEPAYIFTFIEVGIRTDLFTSYENTIVVASGTFAGTYVPAPFSFATVKRGLKLDQEQIDIKSFKFTGNPLNKMWPFALDGLLQVQIAEVDANNPLSSTAIIRFFGDIWSIDSDWKATAIPFGNFFDRKFPRFLLQVSDNYTQFSPPTQIVAASFMINGTISGTVDPTSQNVTIDSAPAHTQVADYFAGGWIECGFGVNVEKRGILHSSPSTGTLTNLVIDRPLIKSVSGTAVNLFPGYDGSIDQCDTKFSNRINFGGHAYIPNVSPAVKAMKPQDVQGGKKRG